MSITIIAEAGVNHNGDPALADILVDVAAEAGADVVKFQTFVADRLATRQAAKAPYQVLATGAKESQHAMLKRLELSRETHERLIARCARRSIAFLSTPFDEQSADMLIDLGIDRFKVPSGELTNFPYLRHLARYGKPVILSTGMATLEEVGAALDVLAAAGTPRDRITVLQCTTEYPAAVADVNLRAMISMRDAFGVNVGYSDHTAGMEIAVAAAAMGATVIEKHFTISRMLPGPDHQASLEPAALTAMIAAIRNVEQALGDGVKRPTKGEAANSVIARKSIVAACRIRAGELFSEANLSVKRPGTGVSPMCWNQVLGRKAPRDFSQDELIEL